MSLIDTTYFIRDIYITGVTDNNNQQQSQLEDFIEAYEKEVLIDAMGFELYTEFMANLTDGDKYQDILDGKTYTKNICGKDVEVRWNGLANSSKESLIAYYTYYYWMEDKAQDNSQTGVVGNTNENSKAITPNFKMVRAWNKYVKLYQGEINSTQRSLAQFIYDMNEETPDTYENWIFKDTDYLPVI